MSTLYKVVYWIGLPLRVLLGSLVWLILALVMGRKDAEEAFCEMVGRAR